MAKIGTREEWLAARLKLLEAEKDLTRRSDALARERRRLPWVRIEKDYVFDTNEGERTLRDLFEGRSQLLVYHFMFGPAWKAGCPVCTIHAESFDRAIAHLNQRDVTMLCVSRAPLEELNAYKARMGFSFRWVSSGRSDFNFDFGVSRPDGADPEKLVFNFATKWSRFNIEEHAGLSAFALENGQVHHTYSCHARGLEEFNVTYQLLDRVPFGRNEDGFRFSAQWIRRRDEYEAAQP
ncbi:MAG TPA: DUF899 domain-containing protein [Rhizomicrobium sp.]|jgi:predicted dithiol-disulfide oxidoreductase (DUF899 family)|nr:DUF899 domain-containing protein [Rhizomicrobium sp.]